MAQQLGVVNFRGSIGDLTYVRTEDGYHVRRKSSLDKARVLTDKRFAGSRRASREFAAAANAGKVARQAVLRTLMNAGDSKLHSRMLKQMMDIIKTDAVSKHGERRPELGNFDLLRGFEFNNKNALIHTFLAPYRAAVDRTAGTASVRFPAFDPDDHLLIPETATHFKLLIATAELDFTMKRSFAAFAESPYFSVKANEISEFELSQNIDPAGTLPVILVLGIRFYKITNGKYYQLHADDFNAVRIVATAAN